MRPLSKVVFVIGLLIVLLGGLFFLNGRQFEEKGSVGQIANLISEVGSGVGSVRLCLVGIGLMVFAIASHLGDSHADQMKSHAQMMAKLDELIAATKAAAPRPLTNSLSSIATVEAEEAARRAAFKRQ